MVWQEAKGAGPQQSQMDPGLATARSSRPNHSTNARSSRRLGAFTSTSTPSPQWFSSFARNRSQGSRRNLIAA